MTKQVQLRKGTAVEHNSFTGALAEITGDTTGKTIRFHDGSTAGGFPLARADGANISGTDWRGLLGLGSAALNATTDFIPANDKGIAGGVATLDLSGRIPVDQIPAIATGAFLPVADQPARLALTSGQAQPGDVAAQQDDGTRWLLLAADPSRAASWVQLDDSIGVTGFNARQGVVWPALGDYTGALITLTQRNGVTQGTLQAELEAMWTGLAPADHDHDGVYATAAHHHDSSYAAITHNHDGDYATITHHHDSVYAALDHGHGTATTAVAGYMSPADKAKLDAFDPAARYYTAAQVDGALTGKAATTHTHAATEVSVRDAPLTIKGPTVQQWIAAADTAIGAITGGASLDTDAITDASAVVGGGTLSAALEHLDLAKIETAQIGIANGIVPLNADTEIDLAFLPASIRSGLTYQGTWDASSNTPALTGGKGVTGHYHIVSVAGSTDIDGTTDWQPGDWIVYNGARWDKADNSSPIQTVFNRNSAHIVAVADDYSDALITNTSTADGAYVRDALNSLQAGVDGSLTALSGDSNPTLGGDLILNKRRILAGLAPIAQGWLTGYVEKGDSTAQPVGGGGATLRIDDATQRNHFWITMTAPATLTLRAPAGWQASQILVLSLRIQNGATHAVTFAARQSDGVTAGTILWDGGVAYTPSADDVLTATMYGDGVWLINHVASGIARA